MFVDTPGIFAPKRRLETRDGQGRLGRHRRRRSGPAACWTRKKGLDANAQLALRQLQRERAAARSWSSTRSTLAAPERALPLIAAANQAFAFAETFIVSALNGDGCDGSAGGRGARAAGGSVAVSRGPALRPLRPRAGRRDHPRADLPPAAPGAALQHHGRDRGLGGSAGRQRGPHRPDHLRPARQPEADPDRQEGPAAQGDRARRRAHELERILDKRVHLFLFVKVRENWLDDPERYREMGLDFER